MLPLRAGPLFSKICYSASAGPLFRYRYFFRSALAALPLVCYSATAIFSIGAINIRYMSDIAIILLISKASTRWRGNLKGLSSEICLAESGVIR